MKPNHPPGAICVASGELARYPHFTHAISTVLKPHGSALHMSMGLNVAANFNNDIRRMLANPDLQWAWIMGDDHDFAPDTLLRLLEHELDIVVPLVVRRQAPFIPVLFREPESDTPLGQFPPYHWHQLPQKGLLEVYTAGSAGMLIRRHVLEAMEDPWFELGMQGKDLTNEDTYFCVKAQKLGYKIYCDVETPMDHWTPISLRPMKMPSGEWTVSLGMGNNVNVQLPPWFLLQLVNEVKEQTKENFGLSQPTKECLDAKV